MHPRSPLPPERPRAILRRHGLAPLATVALLLAAIAGCGADGCAPATTPTPPPVTPPAAGTVGASGIPIEVLLDMLNAQERPVAEKAKIQLLAVRGHVLPYLEPALSRAIAEDRYAEIVKLMIEIAQRPQEREKIVEILLRTLQREITAEKLIQYQRLPPVQPPPKNDEEKRRQKEERSKFLQEQTKIGFLLSTFAAGLLELDAEAQIPVSVRVVYFSSILAEKAQEGREAVGMTSREATANLLAIGPEALTALATYLNSPDDDVSRRFFGVALWMWQPAMVAKILAELEEHGAQNLQIYALLGHLTLRPRSIADLGFTPVEPDEFAKRRAELLAQWHPKLLADWKAWYAEHSAESIDQWWAAGFRRAGIEIASPRAREAIPTLIETLLRDDSTLHVAALHLLQRLTYRDARLLTYLEITEYNVQRAVEAAHPDPKTRPTLDPAMLRALIHDDWKAWHAARADRPSAEWAREEAGYALATLERLSALAKLKPQEMAVGYSVTYFLRLLTRDPQTNLPGVPNLPWNDGLTSARNRSRLIHHFKALVEKSLDKLTLAGRLPGWWPF